MQPEPRAPAELAAPRGAASSRIMLPSRAPTAQRTVAIVLGVLMSAASACGERPITRPVGAAAAVPNFGRIPPSPPLELTRLPMPSLAVAWQPPILVAGDVGALAEALAQAGELRVVTGERFADEHWRERIEQLLAVLGARTTAAASSVTPEDVVGHPLPVVRAPSAGGARPRYDASALRPGTRPRAAVEADSHFVIDRAEIADETWRALPAVAVGSCDAPLQALALGQERSLAALEASLDHADRVLAQMFRAELVALLPPLVDELAPWAAPAAPPGERDANRLRERACGTALAQWVDVYRRCIGARECAVAPRIFLVGGVRIAAREPDVFVPAGCSEVLGIDPVARVRALAKDGTEAAIAELDPAWVELADRLGTVTDVADAMTDICVPRRRRFAPSDLAAAQAKLTAIGDDLGSPEPSRAPHWVFDPDVFRVPGVGLAREIARYDAGPGSPSARIRAGARGLRQFVLSRAVCRASAVDTPVSITVWPAGLAAPSFFGLFHEEELMCAELDPLR